MQKLIFHREVRGEKSGERIRFSKNR